MTSMFRLAACGIAPAPGRLLWVLLLGLLPALAGGAAPTDWRDIESRTQYAWYTEDSRELAAAAGRITDLSAPDPQRSYYLTLTRLREAQVLLARPGSGAAEAAAAQRAVAGCIGSADEYLADRPEDAEVLALQSLCMDLRGRIRTLGVPFAAARGRAQMQRAVQLAPKNPRVRLLAAQLAYAAARTNQDRGQLLAQFQGAVDAFELERQGLERIPAWGAAEAWEGLAQVYLDRGDAIAARSALEHALLLVPDFRSAHRLLDRIVRG
jgi:tetratricopeptide (TPR) repeat protein